MAALTAWSYSRYATYQLCPAQFKYKVIERRATAGSAAMARGDAIHKGIAAYVMGGEPPPPEAVKHPFPKKLIEEMRTIDDKVVEQQWGFTRTWEPTGWFGKATWFRSILDAAALYEDMSADVVDWKTGKKYGSNEEQMELNAVALFRHFKPAVAVTTRMVYLDLGFEDTADFAKADEEKLLAKWEAKVVPMFTDTDFMPRPNDRCHFCDFGRAKGGPCRFG